MPDSRNFVLAGMSRSGTTLMAKLITNELPDAFCGIEPPTVSVVGDLPAYFDDTRRRLLNGLPVGNKYGRDGAVADNPWRHGAAWEERPFAHPVTARVVVGAKGILMFLHDAEEVLGMGCKMIIILRDPIYTLGAWNDPVAAGMDVNRLTRWRIDPVWAQRGFQFKTYTKIERQAEIWEYYANKACELKKDERVHFVRYEDLCDNTMDTLGRIADFLGVLRPTVPIKLQNMNRVRRYPRKKQIVGVVSRICTSRGALGFSE